MICLLLERERVEKEARKNRPPPPRPTTIGASQLAKLIDLDETMLGELANRARLPPYDG
jgi:hypothetical protein